MAVFESAAALLGNTPMLVARATQEKENLKGNLFAKLEFTNPSGSVKDRIAAAIIEDAEKNGRLQPGGVIIEPTSGNTGIGIAAIAAAKGYRAVIVMPDTMSAERIGLIKAYGAEVVLTDGAGGMQRAIEKAQSLKDEMPGAIIAGQFTNPVNPLAHKKTTGPEIWNDLNGRVDIVVAGVGTGGTLSGVGAYLKEQNPSVRVIAVEPAASPVLSKGYAGKHGIQGIGAGFIPATLNTALIDEVIAVTQEEALSAAKAFSKTEGIMIGISAGAALAAAKAVAKREENTGKNIVFIVPDGADRYYSTDLFSHE